MAAVEILLQLLQRVGEIFISPLKHPEMLWLIIPIYINWIFTDLFQERKGTDFGNAITNGAVSLWVTADWGRQLTQNWSGFSSLAIVQIILCVFFAVYGLIVMIESAKGKAIAHYIARVREFSYFQLALTPVFYGFIPIEWNTLFAILLFLPVFYVIGELMDRFVPLPKGMSEETDLGDLGKTDFGKDLGAGKDTGLGAGMDMGASFPQPAAPAQPSQQYQQYPRY